MVLYLQLRLPAVHVVVVVVCPGMKGRVLEPRAEAVGHLTEHAHADGPEGRRGLLHKGKRKGKGKVKGREMTGEINQQ